MKGAARCAALLLLLGAALATVPGRPTVMDIRGGWYRRNAASVSVASSEQASESYGYENYGVEEKEVCLQEVERKACQTRAVDGACSGTGTSGNDDCDNDVSFWTSDLTCCHDKHDYGYSRGSATVGDHLWGSSHGAIGSCDWTWHYVDTDVTTTTPTSQTAGGIQITPNIIKLGSASAICFFGAESHECGGPFCERMVMSLEGNVYRVASVYSYWGVSDTTPPSGTANPGVCDVGGVFLGNIVTGRQMSEGPRTTQAETADAHADTQYYHDEGYGDKRPVYTGSAVVINGIVNNMAGPRKDKWESGTFEYVVAFAIANGGAAVTTGLDSSLPWIRDKAYKFTFYKQAHVY